MKNEKNHVYDSKFVERSKGYYAIMLFMEKPSLLRKKFPNNYFNCQITKNNDCIDELKLMFDYYFFFTRNRSNFDRFYFWDNGNMINFKRLSEQLRLQFEDSNPDFIPRWNHDGETIVVRR